jgi:hypothetical protein
LNATQPLYLSNQSEIAVSYHASGRIFVLELQNTSKNLSRDTRLATKFHPLPIYVVKPTLIHQVVDIQTGSFKNLGNPLLRQK